MYACEMETTITLTLTETIDYIIHYHIYTKELEIIRKYKPYEQLTSTTTTSQLQQRCCISLN